MDSPAGSSATLLLRMVPNAEKVSCSALLSMDLSRFCVASLGVSEYLSIHGKRPWQGQQLALLDTLTQWRAYADASKSRQLGTTCALWVTQ